MDGNWRMKCFYGEGVLNGCRGCHGAYCGYGVADIGERDGQRQEKQECSREFIHDGMRRQKGFPETIAPQEAEDFQDCDPENP